MDNDIFISFELARNNKYISAHYRRQVIRYALEFYGRELIKELARALPELAPKQPGISERYYTSGELNQILKDAIVKVRDKRNPRQAVVANTVVKEAGIDFVTFWKRSKKGDIAKDVLEDLEKSRRPVEVARILDAIDRLEERGAFQNVSENTLIGLIAIESKVTRITVEKYIQIYPEVGTLLGSLRNQKPVERLLKSAKQTATASLRVPMMGADNQRLKKVVAVLDKDAALALKGEIGALVIGFQSDLTTRGPNSFVELTDKLVEISKRSLEAARIVTEAVLNRFTPEVSPEIVLHLTTLLGQVSEINPGTALVVVNAVAERMSTGAVSDIESYFQEALDEIAISSDFGRVLVQRLKRVYSVLNEMNGLSKDEALLSKIKPYLLGQSSAMMGIGPVNGVLRIMVSYGLLGEGLITDDELEASLTHELMHAEKGDEKIWLEIRDMPDRDMAKQRAWGIEFEADRSAAERLLNQGKDPKALIRFLQKAEAIEDALIKESFIKLSRDPKAIPTPPIIDRIKNIETYLEQEALRRSLEKRNIDL